jgi:hypothetical protein
MLKDAEFIAEFEKSASDLEPISGEEVEKVVAKMLAAPPNLVKETKQILGIK